MEDTIRSVCRVEAEDGLEFLTDTVGGELIREEEAYQGVRLKLTAKLGQARIPLQVDVGFGDAVTPKPEVADFPTLLDFPAPRLKVYPKETVVAEKVCGNRKVRRGKRTDEGFLGCKLSA